MLFKLMIVMRIFRSACDLPLYESASHCVEICPDGQFGNGSTTTLTGTCDPCE